MRPHIQAAAPAAGRRHQIGVASLEPGMFVADLDRPWTDTPFLLEGFLVDSRIELETLRRCCRYVYIDPDRSDPTLATAIRKAEAAAESGGRSRPQRNRDDVRISSATRERFRRFVRATAIATLEPSPSAGLLGRTSSWLRGWIDRQDAVQQAHAWEQRSLNAARAALPPGTALVAHPDPIGFDDALPGARASGAATLRALDAVVQSIQDDELVDLAPLSAAAASLVDSMIANPDAPIWLARTDASLPRALSHAICVALYMLALGRSLGLDRDTLIQLALTGLLADVGMVRVPRSVLERPGMLSPSEHALVKEHVRIGLEPLRRGGPLPAAVEEGIAQHHERIDGSGYPNGLRGAEIGVFGRIVAIADCFAALISTRPYAAALAPQEAMTSLYEWAGASFDEALVEQFVLSVGVFPVGSLVELSTGEIGVVMAHNRQHRLEPQIRLIRGAHAARRMTRSDFDPMPTPEGPRAPLLRIARGLPAGSYELPL